MTALTLFYAPGTCALATRIALNEAGAAYTLERVDFTQNAQRTPEYLAINPLGRVPALQLDNGMVLTENVALLAYIAQCYPRANLAPQDPAHFARMQGFHSYLASTVHVAHAHGRRAARWSDDAAAQASMRAKMPQNMRDAFTLIEQHWLAHGGPWVMGAQYTVADGYLFTIARWLEGDSVNMADFPRVAAHHERMMARPAVQAALVD